MANRKQIETATRKGVVYTQDKTGVHFIDGVRIGYTPDFTISSISKYLYMWGTDSKVLKIDLIGCDINVDRLVLEKADVSNFKSKNKSIKSVELSEIDNVIEILNEFNEIDDLELKKFHGDLSIIQNIKINKIKLVDCDGVVNFRFLSHIPIVTLDHCQNFNSFKGITNINTIVGLESCDKIKNLKFLPSTTKLGMEKISLTSLKNFTINIDEIPDDEDGRRMVSNICGTLKEVAFNSPSVSWQDITFICNDYQHFKTLFTIYGMPIIVYYYFSLINGMDDKTRDFKKALLKNIGQTLPTEFQKTVANDLDIEI